MGPTEKRLRLAVIDCGLRDWRAGVREVPMGSNRGPRVEEMLRRAGVPIPNPWCASACFTWWWETCHALGIPVQLPRTGSSSANVRWARTHGRLTRDPYGADLFELRGGPTGWQHTGLVLSRPDSSGVFKSLEGNEGNRVTVRYRNRGDVDFVRAIVL